MSRASLITREFRCMRCSSPEQMSANRQLPLDHPDRHPASFKARFWTASVLMGKPLTPTFRDLRCPWCGANPSWFESYPRLCANFIMPLREDLRPVVFRRVDERGREHYRYPARNDDQPRSSETKVDFPTLRSMTTFLKEQNPSWSDWQVPLNDILDYDEAHIDLPALDMTDPGAADDAAAIDEQLAADDDFGVLDEAPSESDVRMTLGTLVK